MKIKTLNEWLNELRTGFLEPTEENLRDYDLDPNKVTINPDGSIDYDGPVDLSSKGLTSIPFTFNKVNGSFSCFGNQLVSLEGSPREVTVDFTCSRNQLVSLEGGPKKVLCSFRCSDNHLVSLAGVPSEVNGNFYCKANLILYNPTKYKGSFDINRNWQIKNSSGDWVWYSGYDILRMAFGRLGELSREEILGIEEGLKKVDLPDELRAYCENKLYKFLVKYNPKTKTQKFFHDLEMDDDLLGML